MTVEEANALLEGTLSGLLGIGFTQVGRGRMTARLEVRPEHRNPQGGLHGGTVVALADTACGIGAFAHLPDGAEQFTTVELKANFLGTVSDGALVCEALLAHAGRTTQVWDARVVPEGGSKPIALFRCTQLLLSAARR